MTERAETLEKKKTTKQADRARIKEEKLLLKMEYTTVETLTGKTNLRFLVEHIGVRARVEYWNNVEIVQKSTQSTFRIDRLVHDYGLIFNNGFEIRHVAKEFFSYIQCQVITKRERK